MDGPLPLPLPPSPPPRPARAALRTTTAVRQPAAGSSASPPVPVYFVSDSTGISAETMGTALLLQFPGIRFEHRLVPFVRTAEDARRLRAELDAATDGPVMPLVFLTTMDDAVRDELLRTRAPVVDFVSGHLAHLEALLGRSGDHVPARLHGVGDEGRYNRRMQAVEFAMEHDDGASVRALTRADVVLIAPSRCGKTPTGLYLALTHGVYVANYPLVDEDFRAGELPGAIRDLADRCVGLTTSPQRLSAVRGERRSASRYASLEQTRWELAGARRLYRRYGIPSVDSSAMSVEEMATHILQVLEARPPH